VLEAASGCRDNKGNRMATSTIETASTLDQATLDALRESVGGVLAEQCDSIALHAFIDGKNVLDKALWAQAGQLGWLGLGIPEQFGGLGMGAQGLAILHGELGRHSAPGPYIATLSAAQAIVETGSEAMRATWLPRLASGEISAAVPATLDVQSVTRSGAGVSGTLRCVGSADAAFLLAPADDAWVIVDLARAEVTVAPMWDGTRDVIDVRLKDATPVSTLPDAAATCGSLTRAMALAIAADSAGGARSITERTIAYMKTREQFGQPIAGFQALKHRAADLATKLAVADEMVRHAVQRMVTDQPDAELWATLAKSEVTEACVFVTTDCVQLHGGVGFTWDFDPHIFLKRARLNEVLLMTNTALRDQAAAALAAITSSGRSALELEL
jgi:alkylation response protein AidB-like acyl-CoA dehydrogenase